MEKITDSRRIFLQGSLAAGSLGVAVAAGLLTPTRVLAAWNSDAFTAKNLDAAMKALTGMEGASDSGDIKIKAPDIAENGAVVPVTVSTSIENVQSISIVAINNPSPLVASFEPGSRAEGFVATRIKMGKSGDVIAVVQANGKLFRAAKEVKVTIGGCGG